MDHVSLGNYISFFTALAAFNIAYFNSDKFRNIFNRFIEKNSTDIDTKAENVIEVIVQSNLTDGQKQGATNQIKASQRKYAIKTEKGSEILESQKQLLAFFWISSIFCLIIVLIAGCENMFKNDPTWYLRTYYFNLLFVASYFVSVLFSIIKLYVPSVKPILNLVVFLALVAVFLILWLKSNIAGYETKNLDHAAWLSVISSVIIAVLPYLSDLILGAIIYGRNKRNQKAAMTEINNIESSCNTFNNLVFTEQ